MQNKILLAHGGGGTLTAGLIRDEILTRFGDGALAGLPDAARLPAPEGRIAFTTDSYIVSPLVFPGGDIGDLAVCGTVNDLAMAGATPRHLSLGLILEEGLDLDVLRRVLDSVRRRADEAGVAVVTGDTKVAPKGLADGMYINTAGVGVFPDGLRLDADTAGAGDALVVSGPVGRHGTAVLLARGDLRLETPVESDVAPLHLAARAALDAGGVRWMRDLTRGGLAMALADLADAAGLTAVVEEERLPADDAVQAACDLLGLDPLTVACEGAFVLAVAADRADAVCAALRGAGGCPRAAVAGALQARDRHDVEILTRIGSRRVVPAPRGEQLPRIC